MEKSSRICVAGDKGMVGSAIAIELVREGYTNTCGLSREDCDFLDFNETLEAIKREAPEYLFIAAAKVGGIGANSTYPADFIEENIVIAANLFRAAHICKVKKVLYLGSSCIYPKDCPQPIKEEYLMTGPLEPTNDAYAVAKIAGVKFCQAFEKQHGMKCVPVMPTNLYGPGDKYDRENSHVIPSMIMKFHEAIIKGWDVVLWGDGSPLREFMHVDDCARACVHAMNYYNSSDPLNIGTGEEVSISELATMIADIMNYKGKILWNHTMPNGTKRKLLDVSKMQSLGLRNKYTLRKGLEEVIENYIKENSVGNN